MKKNNVMGYWDMRKKYVLLRDCSEMDVLAEDILNNYGLPLVVKNTNINSFIKERLEQFNVERVLIYEFEKDIFCNDIHDRNEIYEQYKTNIDCLKDLLNRLSSGKEIEKKMINNISDSIYSWQDDQEKVISMLTKVKSADVYTYTHCLNTAFYSMLIAKWLRLSQEDIKKAIQSALLHDVGKIKIDTEILNKKGSLTDEEYNEIKNHSLYGYEILKAMGNIDIDVMNGVLHHHERIDGSGYPLGLKGKEINIFSKIVSIADVYDAMISDRVYKKRTSPFEVFKLFLTTGVGAFEPAILDVFINNISVYYTGSNVWLNNEKTGEIVFIPPYDVSNPIIHVESEYIDLSLQSDMKIVCII